MTEQEELLESLAYFANRPYDFVIWAYPWGEPGTDLEFRKGPEEWQRRELLDLQNALLYGTKENPVTLSTGELAVSPALEPWQEATKSGKDVGKSAKLCWLMQWALSTREDTKGRVTANTEKQLLRVLWSELAKWHNLFIAKSLFKLAKTSYYSADPAREDTWKIDAMAWSEGNLEAFQGMHNYGKRLVFFFDEASGIHDGVWEAIDGSMHSSGTELYWFCTSNPTRNIGRFRECFRDFSAEWHKYSVDSREVSFTNKEVIQRAIDRYGIDNDYIKKRFLGEFPATANSQLISTDVISAARKREPLALASYPLIMSADISRFGDAETVVGFRRGPDARSIPAIRWRGLDGVATAHRIAGLIGQYHPDAVFVDEGGLGGPIIDFVRRLGHHVIGVNFGSSASTRPGGQLCANKRAEMYVACRDWLYDSGCVEDSDELAKQLTSIEYYFRDKSDALILISKEDMRSDGIESPDWADQLVMTFAYPVAAKPRGRGPSPNIKVDYNPIAFDRLPSLEEPRYGRTPEYQGWVN